jgi:gamma-glutamyl phosphate reductase
MKKNSYLDNLGKKALIASKSIVNLDEKTKNKVLSDYIVELKKNIETILRSNKKDIGQARKKKDKRKYY